MSFARLILALPVVLLSLAGAAQSDQARVYVQNGVAIAGYDVVIYFTENRASAGSPAHAVMWRGATWHFSSSETMNAFEMNPKAYAPQYGGFCAYAMAEGRMAEPEPEAFSIIDGRLYLNDSLPARDAWSADSAANIARANAHWKAILGK